MKKESNSQPPSDAKRPQGPPPLKTKEQEWAEVMRSPAKLDAKSLSKAAEALTRIAKIMEDNRNDEEEDARNEVRAREQNE